MARRGSQQPRERYQARVNLHDGMGDLWEYVMSHPERSRVHALIVAATLGARLARGAAEGALSIIAGGSTVAPSAQSSAAMPATPPEVGTASRNLDPVDAARVTAGLAGWDLSTDFDAVAPMQ